ncbi:hypothetical protein HY384_02025 [Candidatus Daviesbacteria bacterium]|nr:hypothetical protein [Candidatus Daviesbacteria bacterium]
MNSDLAQLTKLFKINGQGLVLTPTQQKIFDLIVTNAHPRNQIIAPTQYGKSLTVALSVLCRSVGKGEKFIILAPSEKKAGITMNYIIDHCFDSNLFLSQLELEQSFTLDRLRRERSRNHLTFKNGGGIMTLTLDARNSKRSLEAAMGFGGNRLILDESSLIDDPLYATVKRMLGGHPYSNTFLLEIGNPFYRNHFYRTWNTERYNKLFIDYKVGLAEGRYSEEFIEEMRDEAFFSVFYECKFPEEDIVDEYGYRVLLTNEELNNAFVNEHLPMERELYLGADIAGGGDYNVFVMRTKQFAWIESKNRSNDTMTNVSEIQRILEQYPNLKPQNVFVDDIGVGRGVSDRLRELNLAVNGVSAGEKALNAAKHKNIKAECYWLASQWIKQGGKLLRDDNFRQLTWIKYKVNSERVLQIEPKEGLKQRTGRSPDFADAFMLTFVTPKLEPKIWWI